ncbi:MAG TPA: ferritin-like domain-containing protein [Solirubrobacterales bacterium]|jgi:rubrerythrin|nr:ferritin-like domain-containing protein [Solirubrobacterales bacterium]
MDPEISLERVDVDGAVRETAHEAAEALESGDTRLSFLKKAGLAGGAVMGSGALLGALSPAGAMAAGKGKGRPPASFGKGDVGILNFALTLEYLEAAFYNEATANNKKSSFLKNKQAQVFLKTVTADENAHVAYLKKALGSKAVAAPKVDFGATTSSEASFIKTAVALENTGVHAYSGQALNISAPSTVAAALSILTIEARHASVAGLLLKATPANITPDGPFDTPFTAAEVLKAVEGTGFLK